MEASTRRVGRGFGGCVAEAMSMTRSSKGQEVGSTYPLARLPCLHLAAAAHGEQVT